MGLEYPERLSLALCPTPIQKLERLSEEYGCSIWVKRDDLTGNATSGNKIRKLEFTLPRAKRAGADVLLTCGGIQSNHCRTTAILGAQNGFDVHLLLRGEKPSDIDGNLLLDQLAGATISYFSPRYYSARLDFIMQEVSDEYRAKGKKTYVIPTGASDGTGVWGYIRAAEEIAEQQAALGVTFDTIVTATGSGGTQAGLTAGAHFSGLTADVWGMAVCDDSTYFRQKVRDDLSEWKTLYQQTLDIDALSINVCDDYVGKRYAKASPPVYSLMEKMLSEEGLLLDPVYTGKAFYGLLSEIRAGNLEGENILFVHTGGLFGLFGYRDQYPGPS